MFTQLNTFGKAVSPWPLNLSEPVEVLVQKATAASTEVTAVDVERTLTKFIAIIKIDKYEHDILSLPLMLILVDDKIVYWFKCNTKNIYSTVRNVLLMKYITVV